MPKVVSSSVKSGMLVVFLIEVCHLKLYSIIHKAGGTHISILSIILCVCFQVFNQMGKLPSLVPTSH